MRYVNQRWLGGMLTNFQTIQKRVDKMKEYQRMRDSGEFDACLLYTSPSPRDRG